MLSLSSASFAVCSWQFAQPTSDAPPRPSSRSRLVEPQGRKVTDDSATHLGMNSPMPQPKASRSGELDVEHEKAGKPGKTSGQCLSSAT